MGDMFSIFRGKPWTAFFVVQGIGLVCVLAGSCCLHTGGALYLVGSVALLPGSFLSSYLYDAFSKLWPPVLERLTRMDAEDLSDVLYLPAVILSNVLLFTVVRRIMKARFQTHQGSQTPYPR